MSNERLKAFKERIKTDPEYKAHLKARHKERMQNDPAYIEKMRAKNKRDYSKKKANILDTPEKLEKHQQIKLNQFKKSIMTQAELKELKRQQKQKSNENFEAKHGIKYNTYWRWRAKTGITDIQETIECRNALNAKKQTALANTKYQRAKKNLQKRHAEFLAQHGFSYSAYQSYKKKYGGTIEDYRAYKAKIEADRILQKQLDLEIQIEKRRQRMASINPKPITNSYPKKRLIPTPTKESAWQTMQNKISNLNCVISIESIREAKINELQQNFYQQYGAM